MSFVMSDGGRWRRMEDGVVMVAFEG